MFKAENVNVGDTFEHHWHGLYRVKVVDRANKTFTTEHYDPGSIGVRAGGWSGDYTNSWDFWENLVNKRNYVHSQVVGVGVAAMAASADGSLFGIDRSSKPLQGIRVGTKMVPAGPCTRCKDHNEYAVKEPGTNFVCTPCKKELELFD